MKRFEASRPSLKDSFSMSKSVTFISKKKEKQLFFHTSLEKSSEFMAVNVSYDN